MVPILVAPSSTSDRTLHELLAGDLSRRMQGPQRHRLLHGFPLAGALPKIAPDAVIDLPEIKNNGQRELLIGVLPHPFCNPRVAACGFCTFPHEAFRSDRASMVSEAVCREITDRANSDEHLTGRAVKGLYFGGGTANLTPPEDFRRLCRLLDSTFNLRKAEITLEGIPAMFLARNGALLDILQHDVASSRIRFSMGIQTFDEARLKAMGRQAFGNATTFAGVVKAAHTREWAISADLLFNLPDQTLPEMQADVKRAIDLGLDQICLYHLVLFKGLGTPWAHDENMIAGLPENEIAAENWLILRDQLLNAGFVQTSLTNFERAKVNRSKNKYLYEECGFNAEKYEMAGFGPGGISFRANDEFSLGVKTVNPESSQDYIAAVDRPGRTWDRTFTYDVPDLKVFHLTRRLAALNISMVEYLLTFDRWLEADFGPELDVLLEQKLIEIKAGDIRPTPRGMFYGDSIAGVLALCRLRQLRSKDRTAPDEFEQIRINRKSDFDSDGNGYGHM
jgi:coproporphyrinogen III oxidase-like Fe-S oxidoreductase